MKKIHKLLAASFSLGLVATGTVLAAGPYPPDTWPTNIDASKKVHYYVSDGAAGFAAPDGNANWVQSLGVVNGSDSGTIDVAVCGPSVSFTGKRANTSPAYINISDLNWQEWNTVPQIDILIQVYGDVSVLNPADPTKPRAWSVREGTTGQASTYEPGATINPTLYSTNCYNNKWNWILFSVTNKVVVDGTGTNRYVGSIPPGASPSGSVLGGINGGTIRFGAPSPSYLNGITFHAIAFGEAGAFGDPTNFSVFEPPATTVCDPVPDSNLVGIDFNGGGTNNLQIIETDNPMSYVTGVGPAGDLRNAITPLNGIYYNFGILNNYLGKPCNPNVVVKVCMDFYDDPNYAGGSVTIGPESYATDGLGCNPPTTYPLAQRYTLQGTGQWIRKSWTIGGVNLLGVNTGPLTGGPRLSADQPIPVSRVQMAVLRTSGPLANLDPLADCYQDPLVCQGVYGNFAELDLSATGTTNGVDLGNNGGDQTYTVEESGPANDRRMSVRPNVANLNFMIVTNALGPTSQGNLHLAMLVTYYDDPALAGKGFRPQVWKKDVAGSTILAFMDPPQNMVLGGTDKWRDAYWEINAIRLDGVNQSPQAAARFECEGPIHISRVRYQVVRPCGPTAGQNPFLPSPVSMTVRPDTNALVRMNWPLGVPQAILQGTPAFGQPWSTFPGAPTAEGDQAVLRFAPTNSAIQFFRLQLQPQ